jgi:hypothetical protein
MSTRMDGRTSVLAVGFAALLMMAAASVGLGVTSAGAATTTGTIEVCKTGNVSGSFPFVLNDVDTFSVAAGTCVPIAVEPGYSTITELSDPTGATTLQSIHVSPQTDRVSASVKSRTAVVNVPRRHDVTVTFTNRPATGQLKVCKIAGSPELLGQSFTFTEQAGSTTVGPFGLTAEAAPGDCSAPARYPVGTNVNVAETASSDPDVYVESVTGTGVSWSGGLGATATVQPGGTTVVTYTNAISVPPTPGYLEVCKQAGDSYVPQGPWNFTVTDSDGTVVGSQTTLTGQCSGDLSLTPGNYTVTEDSVTSPDYVSAITGIPTAPLTTNLADASGTFAVAAGAAETAVFTDSTLLGHIKVCKTIAANSPLSDQTFNFTVTDLGGTQTISVMAAAGATRCSPDDTLLPIGSHATVTEQAVPNVALTGVKVLPASSNGSGTTSTSADVIVGPSIASATFTNQALGWVEVCKNAADASTATQTFDFSVNGGASIPVAAGHCSQPLQVPAGTATIQEIESNPDFYLAGVTASATGIPQAIVSGPTNGEITVQVQYGDVGDETVATFTDAVNTGEFKICTQESSEQANLAGQTFVYDYSVTDDGVTAPGSVSLTEPASPGPATCSAEITGVPVVNPDGSVPEVTVTSLPPTVTDVQIDNIAYEGSGMLISQPSVPTGFPATQVYAIGTGSNVSTFTDGRTS